MFILFALYTYIGTGTASVHQILCQSWEKCYENPRNDSTRLRGTKA